MYGTPICRRERGGLPASSCVFFTPRHTELKRQSMRKWGSKGKSLCPCYRRMQRCLSEFVATNSAEVHALSCVWPSRKSTYIHMDRAKLFREFLRESFIYKSKISWYFMGRPPILNWRREILSSTWSQTHPLSCPTLTSAQIFAPNLRIPDLRPHTLQQMPLMPLSRWFLHMKCLRCLVVCKKNMVYESVWWCM